MMTTIHNVDEVVKRLAMRAFPEYRGRRFKLCILDDTGDDKISVSLYGGYWDGGSKSYYRFLRLDQTGKTLAMPTAHPYFDKDNARAQEGAFLISGVALVEHSIFCGKDMGLTVTIHPRNAAKLLPEPVELSDDERVALRVIDTYISSARLRMAAEEGLTLDRYDFAKLALESRGLLRKNGSITPAGRDAVVR